MEIKNNQAEFKDHRDLNREMELFMSFDVAPGAPVLLENGLIVYRQLAEVMREYLRNVGGFHEVQAPALVKAHLWRKSGHLEKFSNNMYLFGEEEEQMGLKPMNCPVHMLVFDAKNRSYRDLPYRLYDEGILHRKENSGSLHGLARLVQFHQDDSHIFLAPEQVEGEFQRCLEMIEQVYRSFGFSYRACVATRPEKFLGDEALWARSEAVLESALKARGVPYEIDAGGGAFYGPKICIEICDSAGRYWQVATIQLDFNLPERFALSYIDADGASKRPVVMHMALFGAIERFMGIYLEHVQGNLPARFAPQQVRVYPVADRHNAYAHEVMSVLIHEGVRAVIDDSNDTLGARLRNGRRFRANYSIVIGDREQAARSLAVKARGSDESAGMSVEELVLEVKRQLGFKIE